MILPESLPVTDDRLQEYIDWPKGLSVNEIRELIERAERCIDYDDTLVLPNSGLRETFCGMGLNEFLGQKSFLIQTWHGGLSPVWTFVPTQRMGADFKSVHDRIPRRFPTTPLPLPLLILTPPGLWGKVPKGSQSHRCDIHGERLYKDLWALGVRDAEVYDDEPLLIHAPRCSIISQF